MGIKYHINENFFKIWTPEMAYVLGFVVADGNLEDASYLRGKYLRIHSGDKEILEKIKAVMNSEHTIVTVKPKEIVIRDRKYVSKEKYMLRIGSHEIYNDLIRLGVTPHKSKTITLPNVPLEFMAYFLRGYLDGDGSIYLYDNKKKFLVVTFTSGCELFLQQLSKIICSVLGIKTHKVFNTTGAFQIKYSTKEAIPLLGYIYSDLTNGLYLTRKYTRFLNSIYLYPQWQKYGVVPKW